MTSPAKVTPLLPTIAATKRILRTIHFSTIPSGVQVKGKSDQLADLELYTRTMAARDQEKAGLCTSQAALAGRPLIDRGLMLDNLAYKCPPQLCKASLLLEQRKCLSCCAQLLKTSRKKSGKYSLWTWEPNDHNLNTTKLFILLSYRRKGGRKNRDFTPILESADENSEAEVDD